MSQEPEPRYWAFISYSHRDAGWCDWLHRGIETYRVPRHLVGRETRHGPVPARLFPIFRDREELPTSSDLGEMIHEALRASRYLVVICSPHAARSRWVDAEILEFKRMGRASRILAVIVDGEPNASDKPDLQVEECFPPALRYHVDEHGALGTTRAEPVAADVRPQGDGRHEARLKVIAGLLGVDFDELRQRDLRRRQRRLLAITLTSLAFTGIAVGLAIAAVVARNEAVVQRGRAQAAQAEAEAQRDLARQRSANLSVVEGWRRWERGDPAGSLLWFAEALRQQPGGEGEQRVHRIRIARTLKSLATLEHAYRLDFAGNVLLDPERGRMLVHDGAGPARLVDLASGRLIASLGEPEAPLAAALAGDGRIYTVQGGRMRAWDGEGRLLTEWGDSPVAPPLAVSGDGRVVIASIGTGQALVWDAGRGAPRGRAIRGTGPGRMALSWDGGRLASWGDDELSVFDVTTGAWLCTLRHGDARRRLDPGRLPRDAHGLRGIDRVAFSPDGRRLLTAGMDAVAQVWDAGTGAPVGEPMVHSAWVTSAVFAPDGRRLVTGTLDGQVWVWDAATGRPVTRLDDQRFRIADLFLGRRTQALVTVSAVVRVMEAGGLDTRVTPIGPTAHAALREADRRLIVVSHVDAQGLALAVQRWALPAPPRPSVSLDHGDGIALIGADGPGDRVVTIDSRGAARLWDASRGVLIGRLPHPDAPRPGAPVRGVNHAAFSPDGTRVLTAGGDGTVRVWEADTARPTSLVLRGPGEATAASFGPEGRRVAALGTTESRSPDTVFLWELDGDRSRGAARQLRVLDPRGIPEPIEAYAVGPGGRHLAAGTAEGHVRVWSTETGEPVGPDVSQPGRVTDLAVSPDGSRLATGGADNAMRVWTLAGAPVCATPVVRSNAIASVAFSPDGARVLTASNDSSVRVWDARTCEPLVPPMRHPGAVQRASFGLAGRLVLSTGRWDAERRDPAARVWDAATGALVTLPFPHEPDVLGAAFLADGARLMTAGRTRVAIWDLSPDARSPDTIVTEARTIASRRIDASGGEVLLGAADLLEIFRGGRADRGRR